MNSGSKNMSSHKGIPTLSLFSGAGGLDIGFIQAGFDIRGCVEIEPAYCRSLEANARLAASADIHCIDVRKFDTRPYRNAGIRCIIGGPPCQTFSAAGRRSGGVIGTEDERGQLFKAYCRILDEIKPDVFVFENVYGLPGANGGGPWKQILAAFSRRGYTLQAEVVDAADYGVPQHRERLIMVGYKAGKFVFPMPTHGPDAATDVPLISVFEAISDLQNEREPYHDELGGLYGHLLPLVPEGLNYSYFTAEMGHPHPVFAWRSKFHDLLYKVNRNEPCRTIKAQPGKFTGPFHWKNRHFTLAELKRLQTFPDDYELVGSYGKVIEQIGNSVPPRLAYVLAASVREQLLVPAKKPKFPLRPDNFKSTFRQRQRTKSVRFDEIATASFTKIKHPLQRMKKFKADVSFLLNPSSFFDKTRYSKGAALNQQRPVFRVNVSEVEKHIEIEIQRAGGSSAPLSKLEISGLQKYLPQYNSLSLRARLYEPDDVFHVWNVIEEVLVERSKFFTLIDIYGHYANRGDTVRVRGRWKFLADNDVASAINYFSDTLHCGIIEGERRVMDELGFSNKKLAAIVERLRAIRFDVRTMKTHPIIGSGRILCTYPFPLLSPRALVESKVKLNSERTVAPEAFSSIRRTA